MCVGPQISRSKLIPRCKKIYHSNIELQLREKLLLQWDAPSPLPAMDGNLRMTRGILSRLGTKAVNGRRIIVGLKSDNFSREMLLRLLHSIALRGDSVLAIHVQHSDDAFDPNTFHIHEDLCKSKQVDFEVKICTGSCYITELSHQVRITFATILAVGCRIICPENSTIAKFLKALPPTCKLLIVDNGGKVLFQKMGTSQQGSNSGVCRTLMPSLSESSSCNQLATRPLVRKSFSMPCSSTASTPQQTETTEFFSPKCSQQVHDFSPKFIPTLAMSEEKGHHRSFTFEELNSATQNFCADMLISDSAHSQVYRAILQNGQAAAMKVTKTSQYSEDTFFREVEILSGLKHENIAQLLGYCHCEELYAFVYNPLDSSVKQRLNRLKWSERMQVALGVAKALDYLHSCHPPIIHRAINSSNILLSEDGKPQLSDFGAAKIHISTSQSSALIKPTCVSGTLGYLAPEYIMYGKVDEKVDVYSYGVVLLELITGKEAAQTSSVSHESLALWARSLLTRGMYEHLIDPHLNGDYKKEEIKAMITAAHHCLLHSSTRRPTMKTILRFLEEPNHILEMQKNREDFLSQIGHKDEN